MVHGQKHSEKLPLFVVPRVSHDPQASSVRTGEATRRHHNVFGTGLSLGNDGERADRFPTPTAPLSTKDKSKFPVIRGANLREDCSCVKNRATLQAPPRIRKESADSRAGRREVKRPPDTYPVVSM